MKILTKAIIILGAGTAAGAIIYKIISARKNEKQSSELHNEEENLKEEESKEEGVEGENVIAKIASHYDAIMTDMASKYADEISQLKKESYELSNLNLILEQQLSEAENQLQVKTDSLHSAKQQYTEQLNTITDLEKEVRYLRGVIVDLEKKIADSSAKKNTDKDTITVKSIKKIEEYDDYNLWSITVTTQDGEQSIVVDRPKDEKHANVRSLARKCKTLDDLENKLKSNLK